MPNSSQQLDAMPVDQANTFGAMVMGSLMNAAPNVQVFMGMLRLACTHAELAQLERAQREPDPQIRGGLFTALVGIVMARVALDSVDRYKDRIGK